MKPLWVIQENLNDDDKELLPILDELQVPYKLIKIVPFSDNIVDVDYKGPIVVRGSTTTLKRAEKKSWKPGVWHNENFKPSAYRDNYKELYLNKFGSVVPLNLATKAYSLWTEEHEFVRPNSDYKEFTGGMMNKREVDKLAKGAAAGQYPFTGNLELFIAPYKNLLHEARFVVIDGKPISGCYYRYNKSLKRSMLVDNPKVWDFATKAASMWGPSEVYCLDIGVAKDGEMGVIECNCFNASGIYADRKNIVENISKFVDEKYEAVFNL